MQDQRSWNSSILVLRRDVNWESRNDGQPDAQDRENLEVSLRVWNQPVRDVETIAQQSNELAAGEKTLNGAGARVEESSVHAHQRVGVEDVVVHISVHSSRGNDGERGARRRANASTRPGGRCSRCSRIQDASYSSRDTTTSGGNQGRVEGAGDAISDAVDSRDNPGRVQC